MGTSLSAISFETETKIAAFSAGNHLTGVALPRTDITNGLALALGALKRVALETPKPNKTKLAQFKANTQRLAEKKLKPLSMEDVPEFYDWIATRNFSTSEKQDYIDAWEGMCDKHKIDPRGEGSMIKMFMKWESYTDFKYPRAINARVHETRCVLGPIFSAIGDQMFDLPDFIKKIPVQDRPNYIYERLYRPDGVYYATDISSMEASFSPEVLDVEFTLYEHMLKNFTGPWLKICRSILVGQNVMKNKNFRMKVEGKRMSGEMNTSLGNGWMNLAMLDFLCNQLGSEYNGVFEGDDCLANIVGMIPTQEMYAEIGFKVKLEVHRALEEASFCGQVFDLTDRRVVTDPRYVLTSYGWLNPRVMSGRRSLALSLLRAKSWSLGYQYPACPILSAASRAYLRLTRGHSIQNVTKFFDTYKRELLQEAIDAGRPELNQHIGEETRLLVEKLYGVSVTTQLKYEEYFDNLKSIEPIPNYFDNIPDAWTHCSDKYVVDSLNIPELLETQPEIRHIYPVVNNSGVPVVARKRGMQSYIDARIQNPNHPV